MTHAPMSKGWWTKILSAFSGTRFERSPTAIATESTTIITYDLCSAYLYALTRGGSR